MDTALSAIGVAAVIAIAALVVILVFRDSIRMRIESGSQIESSIGPSGAKFLVGPQLSETSEERDMSEESRVEEQSSMPQKYERQVAEDAKLRRMVPPLGPEQFRIVDLPFRQPPSYYKWPFSPTGLVLFGKVPFFLHPIVDESEKLIGHHVIDLQPSQENIPSMENVFAPIHDVYKVHFLISAGHGLVAYKGLQFLNKRIGFIELLFSDESRQREELILGRDLREWAFGNSPNTVEEIDYSKATPVWVSHNSHCRFDSLQIDIGGGPKSLNIIRVIAEFEDDHPGKLISTPSIIISAITCERIG